MQDKEITPEIKGYNLSRNYKKLWLLIHEGYRIPAWVLYDHVQGKDILDLVEVKIAPLSVITIGTRGYGYSNYEKTFELFQRLCKELELRWIDNFKENGN